MCCILQDRYYSTHKKCALYIARWMLAEVVTTKSKHKSFYAFLQDFCREYICEEISMVLQLLEKLVNKIAVETATDQTFQHNVIYITSNANEFKKCSSSHVCTFQS